MLDGTERGNVVPRPRHADGDDTNGRGLELVDGLADRWGWQAEGAGKSIWCEVDGCVAPRSSAPAAAVPAGTMGMAPGVYSA